MKRVGLALLAGAAVGCSNFDELRREAECRNELPSCPRALDGSVDDGGRDAGGVDAGAGTDAGPRDSGVSDGGRGGRDAGVATAKWAQSEGVLGLEPFRSDLVVNNAGQVLWFVSRYAREASAADFNVPTGYVVSLVPATGQYVQSDGGVLVLPDGGPSRLRERPALEPLPSLHGPPNVSQVGSGFEDAVFFPLAPLLTDGGVAPLRDGGTQRGNGNAYAFISLAAGAPLTQTVRSVGATESVLAAGRLTLDNPSLPPNGVREAYVFGAGASTTLVFIASDGGAERIQMAFDCGDRPVDVVTTSLNPDGGRSDRIVTLSRCNGEARVAAHSGEFDNGSWNGKTSEVGMRTSARMGIARPGVPGRVPYLAVADSNGAALISLDPAGNFVATLSATRTLTRSATVSIEAIAVDDANRPLVVLRVDPIIPVAIEGGAQQVVSGTGLILVQLEANASKLVSYGPLEFPDAGLLRATSAVFAGSAAGPQQLLLTVTCE
ncbi:MAG: hypothetical protein INH37_04190, partial [Myxococcaceae bacterium]|nr:hypothetical protein [Myxococcaceae bacterium]